MARRRDVNLLSLVVILSAACSTPYSPPKPQYHVDVSSFADPATGSKWSFALYPGVEGANAADLEYREFARYIRKALVSNGLIEANDPESAELAIFVNYGIGEPKTTYYSYSMPVLGTTGGRIVHDFSGPFKPSTPGRLAVVGSRNVTGSRTTYYRYLILEALDAQRLREGGEAVPVWETRLTSTGASGDLRRVMPILVAVGEDYFGTNTGQQVTVRVDEDDPSVLAIKAPQPSPVEVGAQPPVEMPD